MQIKLPKLSTVFKAAVFCLKAAVVVSEVCTSGRPVTTIFKLTLDSLEKRTARLQQEHIAQFGYAPV
jgi:hypothetical protein